MLLFVFIFVLLNQTNMLTIGFANQYYTLWEVTSTERYDVFTGATYMRTNYTYIQNLSFDFEAAKHKVEAMADNFAVDLELNGYMGRRYFTERMIKDMPLDRFTFGKYAGSSMLTATDSWQLIRAMNEEPNPRRRVIARRRLLERGELVRYEWQEKKAMFVPDAEPDETGNIPHVIQYTTRKYCPAKLAEALKAQKLINEASGHFFADGQRVELDIKEIKKRWFDTAYGTMYIQTFVTPDGRIVKYKGNRPVDCGPDEFKHVKGTVEHGEYDGVKETRIKRIKVI
jgi:hypothetical protein